jgi:UDP-GlcNAc:undecaprenyl-phosphate/decaprenyl-phosphate GlcNAc-1-phosphate transferase
MNSLVQFVHTYPFVGVFASALIGFCFMPMVVDIAKQHNFVVKPNKRTSHFGLIPNIGGINIFISFFLTILIFNFQVFSQFQFVSIGFFFILLIGFVDDLVVIKPYWKLLGEFVSGFFLIVAADIRIESFFGFMGIYTVPIWISYLVSFFVLLLIINSLNLVDGVDGLASGLGIVYCLFFGVYFWIAKRLDLSISAFAMLGSLVVFFIYNVFGTKRKIFMGDSGALLVGYLVVLYAFQFMNMNESPAKIGCSYFVENAPAVIIFLLIVPLFDTLRVFITRIRKGVSPFRPDKNHIHHLLLKIGFSHRGVTFVLLLVTLFFFFLGLILRKITTEVLIVIPFLLGSVLMIILWRAVDKVSSSRQSTPQKHK